MRKVDPTNLGIHLNTRVSRTHSELLSHYAELAGAYRRDVIEWALEQYIANEMGVDVDQALEVGRQRVRQQQSAA